MRQIKTWILLYLCQHFLPLSDIWSVYFFIGEQVLCLESVLLRLQRAVQSSRFLKIDCDEWSLINTKLCAINTTIKDVLSFGRFSHRCISSLLRLRFLCLFANVAASVVDGWYCSLLECAGSAQYLWRQHLRLLLVLISLTSTHWPIQLGCP